MKHGRRTLRRITRLAAVGGLICGGLMVSNAMAGEPAGEGAGTGGVVAAGDVGASLVKRLGTERTAGSWIGSDGRPVVAVTDEEAAAEVRRAGAQPKAMRYSMRDLRSATETLGEAPRVAGTAWAVDYASNKVVVRADSTVSAADWSELSEVAEGIGGFVQMERTAGSFTPRLNGASAIFSGSGRCSAGFNVTNGQDNFVLTAGHCGAVGTTWFQNEQGGGQVGTTVAGSFPGDDFSLVQYGDGDAFDGTNAVDIGGGQEVRVIGAANPVVGQQVFRSGSTTGLRSGRVTALNATVNYREGTVSGLIETTVCAESGDSGGPLLAEGLALGVTSGGNGDCTTGGTTFFQPVTTAMNVLGVSLVGDDARTGDGTAASSAAPAPAATASAPAAAQPVEPVAPGGPGAGRQTAVTGIVDVRTFVPGLAIIGISLIGLLFAHRYLSEQADRRSYRSQYSQSWG
ncbi:S1 family peptidase [Streptomyces sp. NPDC088400]|uniref:S1 family peptidase n=1 Tax=Streptomyces sp. NPDC088400 TaxID=3365861 RepID=UPI0038247132